MPAMNHLVTFVMPDGTRSTRVLEGVSPREGRPGLGVEVLAELLRRDRGAVSVSIVPWLPEVAAWGCAA